MSAVEFFDAARAYKREITGEQAGLTQEDVDALNAATVARWKPAEAISAAKALRQPDTFFASVRAALGALSQEQVDGFNAILKAVGEARWPASWAAYGLATAWWETAKTMQPVEEAYWVKNADAWRKANLRYYPYYGRGYVQLTWKGDDKNPPYGYTRADEELGLGGSLLANLALALRPDIAAKILVLGMEHGWFTTKKLADYLPIDGAAGFDAFKAARRIINGQDKAGEIAKIAVKLQTALMAGEWA